METFPSPLVSLLNPSQVLAPGDEQGRFFAPSPLCSCRGRLTEEGMGWEEQMWTDVQQQLSLSETARGFKWDLVLSLSRGLVRSHLVIEVPDSTLQMHCLDAEMA